MKSSKFLPTLPLFILLILVTRGFFFWETYIHADEALFALSTKIWQMGGVPYVDFFENKALGVYAFYSLASLFSGKFPDISIRSIHLFSMFWTLLTALAVYLLAARIFSQRAGWIAGAFFILFSSFWGPDIVATHIEVVLLLPWCLTLLCLLGPQTSQLKATHSFLAGLFASAAFLCKYQAGILLPAAAAYYWLVLFFFQPEWNLKRALGHSICFLLGFLPLPAIMLLYLYRAGAWEGFYFWNIQGNFSYIQEGNLAGHLGRQMATQVSRFVGSTLLIWLLGLAQAWQFKKNWPLLDSERRAKNLMLWIWVFLTFIPVSVGKRFEDHYFLFLVPGLSILAAAALDAFSPVAWKRFRIPVLLGVLLPTLGFGLTRFWIHDTYRRWGGEEMNDYRPYGEFLRQRSSTMARVFVWGCAPAVYLFADRLPATRFLRTDTLAGRVAGLNDSQSVASDYLNYIRPGTWELFFEDMKKHPPEYILDTAPTGLHDFRPWPMSQYPQLADFLKNHYVEEAPFQNALVYRRLDLGQTLAGGDDLGTRPAQ